MSHALLITEESRGTQHSDHGVSDGQPLPMPPPDTPRLSARSANSQQMWTLHLEIPHLVQPGEVPERSAVQWECQHLPPSLGTGMVPGSWGRSGGRETWTAPQCMVPLAIYQSWGSREGAEPGVPPGLQQKISTVYVTSIFQERTGWAIWPTSRVVAYSRNVNFISFS